MIVMSFKALTDRLPVIFKNHSLNAIYNDDYCLPNFLKRSFSYRAAQAWNEFSNSITEDTDEISLYAFKRRI